MQGTDLALFDFDGTITTRETFPDFVRASAPADRLASGRWRLAPWIAGYRAGLVSGTTVRAKIVDFAFRGMDEAALRERAAVFARTALPPLLRPAAMARIAWHRQRGDRIVVVSGGFDLYLAPWCRTHGLDLICSSLQSRDGVLTGHYQGAQCVNQEKARQVQARYPRTQYRQVHAYGDTREDRALLALADHAAYRYMPPVPKAPDHPPGTGE